MASQFQKIAKIHTYIENKSIMNIKAYTAWFHDGDLKEILHDIKKNSITITMSSAQIINDINFDEKIKLTSKYTISGKLHLVGIQNIQINDETFSGVLKKQTECATILDFVIKNDHHVSLGIQWFDFTNMQNTLYSYITFEVVRHWWENLPDEVAIR